MKPRWFELEQEIIGAVRRWLDETRDDWLLAVGVDEGSLTAAAIGDAWLGEVRTTVGPAVGSQYIAHLAEHAPRWSGGPVMLNWPEGVEGPGTVEELLARYPDTFAGIDPAQVEWVLARPDWAPSFQRFMAEATNLVVGMPDTAFTEVQRALTKLSNTSKFEQQRAVRSFLSWEEEGGYRGWMRRAERIARTELHTARSAAMDKAAGWLADTGATVRKVWISAADERVRPEHVAANGQTVGYDEPFIVGGEQLWYPGDREHGSPGNTIQCRCVVDYIDEGVGTVREREVENFEELQDMLEQMKKTEKEEQDRARGLTAAGAVEGVEWEGVLAPVGEPSGDGRILAADGQYRFREFPLPLMWQESTLDGHDSARVVGSITEGEVEDGKITARGIVFASEEKVLELLEAGVIRPSVDLCDMVASLDEDTDELVVEAATVMAATLVAKPAFENVHVTVGDTRMVPEDLVAAAAVDLGAYESHWFADPSLEGPTPVTVTEDGRVYGHLALWDSHHVGMPGRRVNPPRSRSGYASFHQSTVVTERGRVAVGRLTVGGGHASARAGVRAAAEHYDETGTCWAFVRAGEDEHGIWVAGEVNHDADPVKVREGAQAPLSGDWRRVGAGLELVAALSVSTPGFPVRRESTNSVGEEYALVAAAAVEPVVSVEDVARAAVDRVWEKREAKEAARSRFKAMEDVSGVFTRVQRHLALEGLQGRFNRAWRGVED